MEDRIALVSGAGGGIGSAVASALGAKGVSVAMVDKDAAALGAAVEKLAADGVAAAAFPADVADSAQVESLVEAVEGRLGPVHYLVNAAGVLRLGKATELTDEDLVETLAVNVRGVCYLSRSVVKRMVQRSCGSVVTVASNAARTPRVQMAAYAASKAAASMFTRCLGLEVARHGIRCNVVAPGSTDTPMLRSMWQDEDGHRHTLEGKPEDHRLGIPLGRIATPDDIANMVVFLLSDQAHHITLQEVTVDGGATLGT